MNKTYTRDKRGWSRLWILPVLIMMALCVDSARGTCPECQAPNPDYDPNNPYETDEPCIKKADQKLNCVDEDLTQEIKDILKTIDKWDPLGLLPAIKFDVNCNAEVCDCCVDGEHYAADFIDGIISGSASFDGDAPIPLGKKFRRIRFDKGPLKIRGSALLGIVINATVGGDVAGTVKKECRADRCIVVSATLSGAVTAKAGVSYELKFTWRSRPPWEIKDEYIPADAEAPIRGTLKYDSCESGLEIFICVDDLSITIDVQIEVPFYDRFQIWKETYIVWKGNCP